MPTAKRSRIKIKFALVLPWLFLSLLLCLLPALVVGQEVMVDLLDPTLEEGVLSTYQGGVLCAPGFRVQAQRLIYTHKQVDGELIHTLVAQGDLMLEYGSDIFVGEWMEYDFNTRTGRIHCGRSSIGPWYAGGESIELLPDGSFLICNGFLTTCESQENEWAIEAKKVRIYRNGMVSAKTVSISFLHIPIFWLPSLETKLNQLRDVPIEFKAQKGGIQGPRIGVRYRFLDKGDFRAYGRLEYFIEHGPGAGLETEYCPPDRPTQLRTQSYIARDRNIAQIPETRWRYRVAGLYKDCTSDQRYRIDAQYDWVSDEEMPSDYRIDDFNLRVAHRSQAVIRRYSPWNFSRILITPRLNTFQTINQRLPLAEASLHTRDLFNTGILYQSRMTAGYLNFVFSRETTTNNFLARGFHAKRIEVDNYLYRPIQLCGLNLQPEIGGVVIGYSSSQGGQSKLLLVGRAGMLGQLRFTKRLLPCLKHVVEPYFNYQYWSNPTVRAAVYPTSTLTPLPPGHFVFTYEDGYTKLNQLRFGLRNLLYDTRSGFPRQALLLDVYAYNFFDNTNIPGSIPRLYVDLTASPNCVLTGTLRAGWNFAHDQIDHFNSRLQWTLSEDSAISCEYRYRSPFDWRKANRESFFLDTFHSEPVLLGSGLSNPGNTLLLHAFTRITPLVSLEAEWRYGWDQKLAGLPADSYSEYKFQLDALLRGRWIFSLYYERDVYEGRWNWGLRLGNKCRPCKPGRQTTTW